MHLLRSASLGVAKATKSSGTSAKIRDERLGATCNWARHEGPVWLKLRFQQLELNLRARYSRYGTLHDSC